MSANDHSVHERLRLPRQVVEVRWISPWRARHDMQLRRFARRNDALAFAGRLRREGVRDVVVTVGRITDWVELPVDVEWDDEGRGW